MDYILPKTHLHFLSFYVIICNISLLGCLMIILEQLHSFIKKNARALDLNCSLVLNSIEIYVLGLSGLKFKSVR